MNVQSYDIQIKFINNFIFEILSIYYHLDELKRHTVNLYEFIQW